MKRYLYIVIVITILTGVLTSCQKEITVNLDQGTSQLAMSAFINNKPETQTIILSNTTGYFSNTPSPAATGATVSVKDNKGNNYNFVDAISKGRYEWVPNPGDTMIRLGYTYTLTINYNSVNYQAVSLANPVPKIDSMSDVLSTGFTNGGPKGSYVAQFFATDFKGRPDYYWIKTYKNDSLLDPQGLNISQDGGVGGPGVDGLPFIYPVRHSINPRKGYALGDTCYVEVHSISYETFFFFGNVTQQTNNGGLFATPPANVGTNIKNTDPKSSVKAVGFFNVAMVSSAGLRIK